jgi:hypothetical protein
LRHALVATLIAAMVLTALPFSKRLTPPAQAMQSIRPCISSAGQIIQNCKLGGNYESEMENLVINDLLKLHKLPASDRARLLGWERDEIRAGILDRIIGYIRKPAAERSADEQAIVTALTNRVKERRVLAATKALEEFNKWLANCPYTPPPGFEPYYESCQLDLSKLFSGRTSPSFEQFQAYGAALAGSQLQTDPDAQRVMRETATRVAILIAAGATVGAGVIIGTAVFAAGLLPALGLLVFPFTATSTLAGAVSIAAPVAIVLLAVVIAVTRGIQVFEQEQIPTKLQQAKTNAENDTPNLAQIITTENGQREVFGEFLLATLPDFSATSGVPAAQTSDPKFEVSPSGLNSFTATPTLQYKDWDGNPHTLRMNGRWFVDQKGSEPERLTLSIEFLNSQGRKRLAARVGSEFLIADVSADKAAPIKSNELQYLNWNGEGYVAKIIDRPPTITAVNVTQPQLGGFAFPLQIATVADADDPAELLTVAGASPLSSNGITLSDITVEADGTVKARFSTSFSCPTSDVNAAFTLQVTDTHNQSALATVNVTVPANLAPALTYAPAQSLVVGGSTTIAPTSGPSDPDESVYKNFSYVTVGQPKITPLSPTAPPFAGAVTLWQDPGPIINPAPTGKIDISNAGPIGAYRVELPVTDGCGLTTVGAFTLNVTCLPVNLTAVVKDPTCYGASNGQITVNTSPNVAYLPLLPGAMLYSIDNGQSFSASNVFTGLAAGAYDVVVKDASRGCISAMQRVTLTQPTALGLTPNSLPTAQAGIAFSQSFTASGGSGAKTVSLQGALPAGVGFSQTANGATLAGAPTQTGAFPLTLTVTDQNNCTITRNVTLTVACPTVALAPETLPNAQPGANYSVNLSATPAGGNYTYALTNGAAPPGVTLQPNGLLTGKPTKPGVYNFRVTAAGFSGKCGGGRDYQLTVTACAAILLSPTTLPNGATGVAYSQNFSASPAGAYSFAVTIGALPPGLTLQPGGQLSGVPTLRGVYNFTVTATDAANCVGRRAYKLTIDAGAAGTQATARGVSGDYDGDGKTDFVLWRGETSEWLIVQSSDGELRTEQWSAAYDPHLDALAPGDYDGDGKFDLAVFRSADGHWRIKQSSDGQTVDKYWGTRADLPVPADYDGDGKTDIAVYGAALGAWLILRSSDGETRTVTWGTSRALFGDAPVPADYDGDGKADIAVYRTALGHWFIRQSSDGQVVAQRWGVGADMPVPADYDGDGKADIAVWRGADANCYIVRSSDRAVQTISAGASSLDDAPAPGDYDGDGKADLAVWRAGASEWLVKCSGDDSVLTKAHGQAGDLPALGRLKP